MPVPFLSRRELIGIGLSAGTLFIAGCSAREGANTETNEVAANTADDPARMVVHRDPNCGCCHAWAEQARSAGYSVQVVGESDMDAVKRRLGVPAELASCHTTTVAGLVFEGHVPFGDVARLIRERPAGVTGLAVPGMPAGSPGMETSDGTTEPFEVIAFGLRGRQVFSRQV